MLGKYGRSGKCGVNVFYAKGSECGGLGAPTRLGETKITDRKWPTKSPTVYFFVDIASDKDGKLSRPITFPASWSFPLNACPLPLLLFR